MWNPVVTRTRLLKCGNVGLSRLRCNVSDKRCSPCYEQPVVPPREVTVQGVVRRLCTKLLVRFD